MKEISDSHNVLNVLCLEDVLKDAELINEILADAGYQVRMDLAPGKEKYIAFLKSGSRYDLILADYTLPEFNAPAALKLAQELQPEVSFICLSGTIGEEKAVELLKLGATDYVLKDRPERLVFAVRQALLGVEQRERWLKVEAEKLTLIHELEVFKIELKIQNDQLILSHEQEAITAKKYIQLYDFAPSGYFTLSISGEILELNLAGARMLGKERSQLKNSQFGFYISIEERPIFSQFLEKVRESNELENCEVMLSDNGKIPVFLHLTGIASKNGDQCQVTTVDISERKQAEEEICKSNAIHKQLLTHMTEIRENERALISREIHDQLGQSLTALKLDLNWLLKKMNKTPEINEKLSEMVNIVTSTIKDVQRISSELRPGILDDLGLAAAIEWYADEFEKRSNLIVNLDLDEVQAPNEQANVAIFRVMQESLTNIIRHARAKSVHVSLHEMNEHIVLDIEDDGIGMSLEKLNSIHSLGLLGMHDRVKQVGGTIDILCGSDAGTKIRICIASKNISPELSKYERL